MEQVTIPYSGRLLVAQLAAYGLAVVLDEAGIDVFVGHDPESQSFEPVVAFDGDLDAARAAIRASAEQLERVVEHDIEPGRTGNDRRATIWARATFGRDDGRLRRVLALRRELLEEASPGPAVTLLGGLGAPLTWGPERLKTSAGATALDGVLGNHTSDFVRGVLRRARPAAAALEPDPFTLDPEQVTEPDRTLWAPPGTRVDLVHQWLAALGLSLLPVAHRPTTWSATPAAWSAAGGDGAGRRRGVTLPLLAAPVSLAGLRARLALAGLVAITGPMPQDDEAARAAAAKLRTHGIDEVVVFERRDRGGSSSVAFDFRYGQRVALT